MNPMVLAALINAGSRVAGGLIGRGGTKLTGGQADWLAELKKMYSQGMPDWMRSDITSGYGQFAKDIKQKFARQPGISGALPAILERKVYTPQSQALSRAGDMWKRSLIPAISGMVGMEQPRQPTDWGNIIGGTGGDITFLLGLLEALKGGGTTNTPRRD